MKTITIPESEYLMLKQTIAELQERLAKAQPKQVEPKPEKKGAVLGGLAGKGFSIPDDFNAPIDDLKDYM